MINITSNSRNRKSEIAEEKSEKRFITRGSEIADERISEMNRDEKSHKSETYQTTEKKRNRWKRIPASCDQRSKPRW